jgi:hypothetical protein
MEYEDFINELGLEDKVLSINLTNEEEKFYKGPKSYCLMKDFDKLENGNILLLNEDNLKCIGELCGIGYNDGLPNIPGGFGNFISNGKERIKKNPEIGEKMFYQQPKNVIGDHKYVVVKHYEESDNPTTVSIKVTPDQLSGLVYLFNFEKKENDNIYASVSSGCSSIFRMPFHEAKIKSGRGVIGNLDFNSRVYTDKNTLYFTVSGEEFKKMLKNADESFMITPMWKKFRKRRIKS